jgi:hypothetical protein
MSTGEATTSFLVPVGQPKNAILSTVARSRLCRLSPHNSSYDPRTTYNFLFFFVDNQTVTMNHDANKNNLPSSTDADAVIPPGSDKKGDAGNTKPRGWTAELDIALLEEVGNCCAHTPGQNQATKCWENVLVALKNRGIPFDSYRTVQRRWSSLKDKFIKERAKQEATAGVENFGDDDDDPFGQMMEDLLEEMKDFEAEKFQKREDKKNSEEALVAGGKTLRDKAAHQILCGAPVVVGGGVATLRPSPTSSVSDIEASSKEPSTSSKKRPGHSRLFNDFDLVEHENKRMELDLKKFELETKKFEAEMELKRDVLQQNLEFHRDAMEMKKQEIVAQHQAIQVQIMQHQDTMRLKFLQLEQRKKNDDK